MNESRSKSALLWAIGLIVLAVLIVFGPLVRNGFTDWDDQDTIWNNPHLRPATWESIQHYWQHAEAELYIPVTYTVWGGIAHLAERKSLGAISSPYPAYFHAASVLAHALAAVVVFLILRRLIKKDWPACAGALLFALHPMQTEAVAWASGMKDVLCGLFVLTALWQYIAWVQDHADDPSRTEPAQKGGQFHYIAAMLALILGMLCKPTAVVMPALALVIDITLIRHSLRLALKSLWPLFVTIVPCMIVASIVQPAWLGAHVPLLQRPMVAGDALTFYLWKLIWPTSLTIDYGRTPTYLEEHGLLGFTWILPVILGAILFYKRKQMPPVACGALLMIVALGPVLGFVPFEFQTHSTVTDHYLYISMLGVALAAAWAVANWPAKATFYVAAIVLGICGLRSMDQSRYWKDSPALFAHTIEINPNSSDAYQNLGVLTGSDAQTAEAKAMMYAEQRDMPNARDQHTEALRLLAQSDALLGKVLDLKPGNPSALHNRALLHARFGRHEEAIADLKILIKEMPTLRDDDQAIYRRDDGLLGRELLAVNRPNDALDCFNGMLQRDPTDRTALRGKEKAVAMAQVQLHTPTTAPAAAAPMDSIIK